MDTIGNMITSLLNASRVKKDKVVVPGSNLRFAIAQALFQKGYIKSYARKNKKVGTEIEIELAYDAQGNAKIQGARRVSKPSRRVYAGVYDIYSVKQGHGMLMLSTPKGILAGKEAKKEMVGGEVLFEMW
jgi:small subunit ribosomal protein S8